MRRARYVLRWDLVIAPIVDDLSRISYENAGTAKLRKELEASRDWLVKVVKSNPMRKAFHRLHDENLTAGEVRDSITEVAFCLQRIKHACAHADRPQDIIEPPLLRRFKDVQWNALIHLQRAEAEIKQLGEDESIGRHVKKIRAAMVSVAGDPILGAQHGEPFNPANLKRRRTAAAGEGAFRAWMVRELGRLVPPGEKRSTAISELLALVGVDVDPQYVRATLSRGEN